VHSVLDGELVEVERAGDLVELGRVRLVEPDPRVVVASQARARSVNGRLSSTRRPFL